MCVFAEACVRVSLPVDAAEGCQLFEFSTCSQLWAQAIRLWGSHKLSWWWMKD